MTHTDDLYNIIHYIYNLMITQWFWYNVITIT